MEMARYKKLVYWGAGKIGEICLTYYSDIKPLFFIDSFATKQQFNGIEVLKPEEIQDWSELFIVITNRAYEQIGEVLAKKNLVYGSDFVSYQEYFHVRRPDVDASIEKMKEYINQNPEYVNSILLVIPLFFMREPDKIIHFFKHYRECRLPDKCIFLSSYEGLSDERAAEEMGAPVFNEPQICGRNGKRKAFQEIEKDDLKHREQLSEEEKAWIVELEKIKNSNDKDDSFLMTSEMFWYYKQVISILKPAKIVIWGGWMRKSYIVAHLAKCNHIPYGFMEYGWIPGTLQFDRGGIAGQSEYAKNPEKLLGVERRLDNEEIERIFAYIRKEKLDTTTFLRTECDEKKMQRLDNSRKNVFFVGMSEGIEINPKSDYWKQNVSSLFLSTKEAVEYVYKVCQKNKWNLIFKPHPDMKNNKFIEQMDQRADIAIVRDAEIDRLINLADCVVSIASAVDYKALIYEKPLVQLGKTGLAKKGCTYEVDNREDIEMQMQKAICDGMTDTQKENYRTFVAQLLENYLWDDLQEKEVPYGQSVNKDFFM